MIKRDQSEKISENNKKKYLKAVYQFSDFKVLRKVQLIYIFNAVTLIKGSKK